MTEVGIYMHLVSELCMVLESYIIVERNRMYLCSSCIVYIHHLCECSVGLITISLRDEYGL